MRTRILMLAIVLVGACVSLIRVPVSHLDTVWAEDGTVFLSEAMTEGPLAVLVKGYAGYQHLIPRIVTAILVPATPLAEFGLLVFISCAVLTGLVALAVFWLSRDLVPWLPARLALAAITIILPLSAQEVLGNLADFHSYCMWLAPWLALYRPRRWAGGIGWGVVALLVAATEIQALLFLPLVLLNWRRERRTSWPIAAGLALGGLAQVATAVLSPRESTAVWRGALSHVQGYLHNTVLPMLNPNPAWQAETIVSTGAVVPVLVLLPFVAAGVVALVWGNGRQRILAVTLAVASVAIYVGGATIDGSPAFGYAHLDHSDGFEGILNSRYGVSSGMMLAALVPLAAAVLVARSATRPLRAVQFRFAAWFAVVGLTIMFAVASTQSVSDRSSGVTWSGGIAAARLECTALAASDPVWVRTAPDRFVRFTCGLLTEFG